MLTLLEWIVMFAFGAVLSLAGLGFGDWQWWALLCLAATHSVLVREKVMNQLYDEFQELLTALRNELMKRAQQEMAEARNKET